MKKVSKSSCKSASHRLFKDKAKNRVDDLQLMFLDLQFARKAKSKVSFSLTFSGQLWPRNGATPRASLAIQQLVGLQSPNLFMNWMRWVVKQGRLRIGRNKKIQQ